MSAAASAQNNQETDNVRERVDQLAPGARTGVDRILLDAECEPASFEDILDDPDNAQLNLCFARQQIAQGDVAGAASTLERILLLVPNAAEVRLLYAIVLYRLDAFAEAQREFRAVEGFATAQRDKDRIARYLDLIEKRQRRTRQTLTFSIGGHYDTNRNAAPASDELVAFGVRTAVSDDTDDDIGILGSVRYDVAHDLQTERRHEVIGSLTYYHDDQVRRDELDLQSVLADVGVQLDLVDSTLTPKIGYTNMRLSKQKFYASYEVGLRYDRPVRLDGLQSPVDIWVTGEHRRERFRDISENTSLSNRDGTRSDFGVGTGVWITGDQRVTFELEFARKNADSEFQSYRYYGARAQHVWLLGSGQFLNSSLSYGVRQYRAFDPFVTPATSPQRRREQPMRLQFTYGVPLETIAVVLGSDIGAFFGGINLAITGEYFAQDSNITNYEYDNFRSQVLLTKRIEF